MASATGAEQLMDLVVAPRIVRPQGPESVRAAKHIAQLRHAIRRSPNIVGIGVALKVTSKKTLIDYSLTFFVVKKVSLSRLSADEGVPPLVTGLSGKAIATDVVEIGHVIPEANVQRTSIVPGYSVGHFREETGTLGAIVARGDDLFVLSNSHVLAESGRAKHGDPIIYPGRDDGGKRASDTIARLGKFIRIRANSINSVDAAIAKIGPGSVDRLVARIKGIGFVKGTTAAKVGMRVVKFGRTTGRTTGRVLSRKFRLLRVPYPGIGDVSFGDQILISRFTKPGDSGSLVIDLESRKAVGLHFAGAKGGSVAAPIDAVLRAMGVSLVMKDLN